MRMKWGIGVTSLMVDELLDALMLRRYFEYVRKHVKFKTCYVREAALSMLNRFLLVRDNMKNYYSYSAKQNYS